MTDKISKTPQRWRQKLTAEQFREAREKGSNYRCGAALFRVEEKLIPAMAGELRGPVNTRGYESGHSAPWSLVRML
jgi:hypothetical protein